MEAEVAGMREGDTSTEALVPAKTAPRRAKQTRMRAHTYIYTHTHRAISPSVVVMLIINLIQSRITWEMCPQDVPVEDYLDYINCVGK